MNYAAMAVGHDLKFNVARIDDELFQIHLIAAKCFLRLVARTVESRLKAGLVVRSAHPAPAAARRRFDHHRVSKSLCDLHRLIFCLDDSIAPRRYRHTRLSRSRTSSIL